MSLEVDPSTLNLALNDLSKITKKDLVKYFSILQGMYVRHGRKYDKAKSIIHENRSTTEARSTNVGLIPKPCGRRSCDFKIYDEMQVKGKVKISKNTYKNLISYIHLVVESSDFDMNLPLKNQELTEVAKVITAIKERYPFIRKYRDAWPATMLIRQFLNNHHGHHRAKMAVDEETPPDAAPSAAGSYPATPTPDLSGNDDSQDKESDVSVSDIDD
ncbi:hypothetical protein BDM02DRAFT_3132408 [Thelephora ganbajun]|uniref:Uncharacterized protein n=1 Tax=Thelephora ganbajun TaxID=370292 RepID=A0ACB6Z1R1_THEGA|nr:hypothetical protein BDM02DRAFT_3132408 [Thelephora ganbajun]